MKRAEKREEERGGVGEGEGGKVRQLLDSLQTVA